MLSYETVMLCHALLRYHVSKADHLDPIYKQQLAKSEEELNALYNQKRLQLDEMPQKLTDSLNDESYFV